MAAELICDCRKRRAAGFQMDAGLRVAFEKAPVLVLFGPSGSGKTTLLRLIAGLEEPDEGAIAFAGETWCDVGRRISLPPQRRRAGLVFQEYALFPHLTVAGNIAYAADGARARELVKRFGLEEFADRLPATLSGGQQQRVALARALAANPALLLLDEPLSALDAEARTRVRGELRRMLLAGGVPSIVVTHDRTEAIALGDAMAVMIDGRIRQTGSVSEVFGKPADAEVARSCGVENVLAGEIVGRAGGLLTVQTGPAQWQCLDGGETGPVFACIRAEDVALSRETGRASSVRNHIAARVTALTPEGALARIELDCGFPLVASITAQSAGELALQPGDAVRAIVKTTAVHLTAGARLES